MTDSGLPPASLSLVLGLKARSRNLLFHITQVIVTFLHMLQLLLQFVEFENLSRKS